MKNYSYLLNHDLSFVSPEMAKNAETYQYKSNIKRIYKGNQIISTLSDK